MDSLPLKTPTVDPQFVQHILARATAVGVDTCPLLQKTGLDTAFFQHPDKRLPAEKVAQLLRYCRLATNDEEYGFLEKPIPLGQYRLIVLACTHMRTVGKALQRYIEFMNSYNNGVHMELQLSGPIAHVDITTTAHPKPVDCAFVDIRFVVIHRTLGWISGQTVPLHQVMLSTPAPDYRDEYQYLYHGTPVLFNQPYNRISFSAEYLDVPIVLNEESIENYLRRAPLDLFFPQSMYGDLSLTIRNRIHDQLVTTNNLPTLTQLAETLGYTPKTLQRRLRDEGSNIHDIKLQVRRDIAVHHLSNDNISIEDIAEKAGYTEASVFVRAFKNWTGMTPLKFRKGFKTAL